MIAGRTRWGLIFLGWVFFAISAYPVSASRFALFALDIQEPLQEGKSVGETRKVAIAKGLSQAVEEATYKIIPQEGLDTSYQKLKSEIFDRASRFVPQYKILGERKFPGTFNLSLQVTVDLVLLRKALLSAGVIRTEKKEKTALQNPSTLEIRNLVDGKTLTEILHFFKQRPDLVDDFEIISARHGDFVFRFYPLQSLGEITSQILYHAQISEGTFKVIKQEKNHLILSYRLEQPS